MIYCSCNGKKCEGLCKKIHLHKKGNLCGAAYNVDEYGKESGQLTITKAFEAISKKGKK